MNIQAALVKLILEHWDHYAWTIQGFGFARVKIADVGRIHVWDSRLAVPLVSTVHTHPWPLKSTIISGELINSRFVTPPAGIRCAPYVHQRLKTGEGGGLVGEPEEIRLSPLDPRCYLPGDTYEQAPDDIHRTQAQDGTVTLLERPQGPPLEEASVYWPIGMKWVSAEPRKPSSDWELSPIMTLALERWHAESTAVGKPAGQP